jgi:poly-gamma-glutamate synthesis protein (capsule biosynthesis protein)
LLSCCDHQADFAAAAERPGIWYLNLEAPDGRQPLLDRVEALANRVDHLVVALHWQPNWAPVVPSSYRRLAGSLADAGARVVWGHSPHHFQGVEWTGNETVTLYSTGDLLTDYAVDPGYRNDRQLLFAVTVGPGMVMRVRALPVELGYAATHPASRAGRQWIVRRFGTACGQVGSQVHDAGEWLDVRPSSEDYAS